ncbi:MAG: sorbosone dehydrogenase family protein [Solirubrobacterales bacterium]
MIAALLAATAVVLASTRTDDRDLGPKHLALERIGKFDQPTFLTQPPKEDGLLFVTERRGVIRVVRNDHLEPRPFLDIHRRVKQKGAEQGLLSMAFAPDYDASGLFYVAYTGISGDLRIYEFQRTEDKLVADRDSGRSVLRIHENSSKHHGGLLLFGPDEHLYVGSGDGGPSFDPHRTAQARYTLLGKILRIDPRKAGHRHYTVPNDNPFVGRHGRDEIYSYGLRNPWRFSFDPATGLMAIGDVGQDRFEEIDLVPADSARGANFGWSAYEANGKLYGGVPRDKTVAPALAYPHGPGCSVTGGYVVRDPRLAHLHGREVVGRYMFGDYCTGKISIVRPPPEQGGEAGRDHATGLVVPRLTSFGEDRDGHLYALSQDGPVYRIRATRRHG